MDSFFFGFLWVWPFRLDPFGAELHHSFFYIFLFGNVLWFLVFLGHLLMIGLPFFIPLVGLVVSTLVEVSSSFPQLFGYKRLPSVIPFRVTFLFPQPFPFPIPFGWGLFRGPFLFFCYGSFSFFFKCFPWMSLSSFKCYFFIFF
jgi:hypothetical protein